MEMRVAHLHAFSLAPHLTRTAANDDNAMPDNKSWRRKVVPSKQTKKPARDLTPLTPFTPLKVSGYDVAASEDPSDRRRHHSWRKGSRPETPVSGIPTTPAIEDTEDAQSERSETSAPRRNSKPKLARYTSLFSSFKETSKGPEFAEPWSEDAPPPFMPYVDPLDALQSVRSHMMNISKPIPVAHHNGLFRIFEDYRKTREEKERLEALLQDTLQGWGKAEEQWNESEGRYQAEIRRLDLHIARGTSGMTGLMKARKESVVDRKRRHRKTVSNDGLPPMCDFLSREQLDIEIKLRSQRVLLHRPISPSGNMTALSKQFTGKNVELPVGNPPGESTSTTLSRKVQSELNLASLARMDASHSITSSLASGFSGSTGGDTLPDETTALNSTHVDSALECDALVALRELGALVARRRGLKVDSFLDGLTKLFSNARGAEAPAEDAEDEVTQLFPLNENRSTGVFYTEHPSTPRRALRKFQSQPQLNRIQKHRRQFSFEPGADQLQALEEESRMHEAGIRDSSTDVSSTPPSPRVRPRMLESLSAMSTSSSQTLSADFQKPSKIPSPVQTLARMRRENSASSLQSAFARPTDSRRDSRSSILTAFRQNSTETLPPASQSRSSSNHTLRAVDSSLQSKEQSSGTPLRNHAMALAAARMAANGSQTSLPEGDSSVQSSTRPSTSRSTYPEGLLKLENDGPKEDLSAC
ncbi:hypothetical protein EJ02DRAFT_215017 [Clathrospora elynae]|uniref:Uncharacterized protein n=1 Tax=Clathrospora elynae TaxID=706981 RepID=A0A6A5T4E4_9PLEO|nr:hypothetical protein EJ02DRAFT_215017 [Clathrospora elynae]